ncbi:MAG: metallophosphoesterase [Nitrososphaerota archaeon]
MVRIGILSDTHVGRDIPKIVGEARRKAFRHAFREAVNILINSDVDLVLHAGDLFEKKSMRSEDAVFVKDEFYRLVKNVKGRSVKDVNILIIRGNHDGTFLNSVLDYVTHPLADYFRVLEFDKETGLEGYYIDSNVAVIGVGYYPHIRSRFKNMLDDINSVFSSLESDLTRILLIHNYIESISNVPPSPQHTLIDLDDVMKLNLDIVVAGHYHERDNIINVGRGIKIIIPGATEAIDLDEKGPFGVYIIDVDEEKNLDSRFIPIKPLQKIEIVKIYSEKPQSIEWYKKRAVEEILRFAAKLYEERIQGILKIKLQGTLLEEKYVSKIFHENELEKIMKENSLLLFIDIEENLKSIVSPAEYTAFKRFSREELIRSVFKDVEEESVAEIVEETTVALEEKGSERTGLLKDSDRSIFVDKWVKIFLEKAEKIMEAERLKGEKNDRRS